MNRKTPQIKRWSTKCLTSTFQTCQDQERQGKTGSVLDWEIKIISDNEVQCGKPNWILKLKKDISENSSEI